MLWICRAGKNAVYIDTVLGSETIRLFWDGYIDDYSMYNSLSDFRDVVIKEKPDASKTSVSNWATQLFAFCKEMKKGDYVLIPYYKAKSYIFAVIEGEYEYIENDIFKHSRKIRILKRDITKDIFPQNVQFSLNAFRTVYKVKCEEKVIDIIGL